MVVVHHGCFLAEAWRVFGRAIRSSLYLPAPCQPSKETRSRYCGYWGCGQQIQGFDDEARGFARNRRPHFVLRSAAELRSIAALSGARRRIAANRKSCICAACLCVCVCVCVCVFCVSSLKRSFRFSLST